MFVAAYGGASVHVTTPMDGAPVRAGCTPRHHGLETRG
jgi:hypothetical protein